MTQTKTRVGVAALTAAASMAGVFALATPANAAAFHPDPVRDATAVGGTNQIAVNWDAADTGEPATSYVVVVYNELGVQIGDLHIVLAPTTEITIKDLPAGKYYTEIFSHNAYPGFGGPVRAPGTGTVTVTAPAVTPPPAPIVNTLPYRPYKNWDDMIDQEYRFWTGCLADTTEVDGRFPRDDEFTYWRAKLTDWRWSDLDWDRYDAAYILRSRAEWTRLTNGATFDPPAWINDVQSPGYKTSIAYKALYDKRWAVLTSIPSGGGFMPADNGAGGGIANNNILEPGELAAARVDADNYARWAPHLIAEYGAKVNALANQQAVNDVYFARRVDFVRQLAEDAEQTDGPAYRLYTAYFSRIPDAGGLCFWSNRLRNGWSLLDVSDFFVESEEFEDTYGGFDLTGGEDSTDAAEFVALVYRNVLNRDADAAGAAFWTRQLQSERYTPAEMLIGFSESQEFKNRMSSKVGTGLAYLHLLGRMPTEAEYVAADWNWTFFQTNPTEDQDGWMWFWDTWGLSAPNSYLYQYLVDHPGGEYTARANIEIPSHHHPHEVPGTQPL